MGMNRKQAEELLGAWALDALDDTTGAELDAYLATDASLAAEARDLRGVVGLLAEPDASPPPASLRSAMLGEALTRRPSGRAVEPLTPAAPIDVFAGRVADLIVLAASLTDDDWSRPAAPYTWSVHELFAHLVAVDAYFASLLGLMGRDPTPEDHDHLAIGDPVATAAAEPPVSTLARWSAIAERTVAHLRAGVDLGQQVMFHELPYDLGSLLVARSFELWTHADDIRRACGRELVPPPPGVLRTMSMTSVGALPLLVFLVRSTLPDTRARVVLTGEGGGVFEVVLGNGGDEAATLIVDVVDYCRCAASRIPPGELNAQVIGDAGLARLLLDAASALAV